MNRLKRTAGILMLTMVFAVMTACGNKSIVGTWSAEQNGSKQTYIFNEDGSGSMDIGEGIVLPIKYSTESGKVKISYTLLGSEIATEYTYTLEKKTLTLSDSSSSVTLNRQE